jgi:hypothetical protein
LSGQAIVRGKYIDSEKEGVYQETRAESHLVMI